MTEEKTVIQVAPDQIMDPGQELPDLKFTVKIEALDDLTIGQYAALQNPSTNLFLLIEAIEALTEGLDVSSLKSDGLTLVSERIAEAIEFRRASKNSGAR